MVDGYADTYKTVRQHASLRGKTPYRIRSRRLNALSNTVRLANSTKIDQKLSYPLAGSIIDSKSYNY